MEGTTVFGAFSRRLAGLFRALGVRFDSSPIDDIEALEEFVLTRSSHTSQTALYGYLRERMGTRYRDYFQDETFAPVIQAAAVRVFLSCLTDLAIYSTAVVASEGRLDHGQASGLARHCFQSAAARALAEVDSNRVPPDALASFDARTEQTDWARAANPHDAFAGSETDLIRHAPVVDEFKELDSEIVRNSIRFRWRDVRQQLRKRIDPGAVAADWLAAMAR